MAKPMAASSSDTFNKYQVDQVIWLIRYCLGQHAQAQPNNHGDYDAGGQRHNRKFQWTLFPDSVLNQRGRVSGTTSMLDSFT